MAQNNISCFYADIHSESEDSIYIAIHNHSPEPVCLFTGFLYSSAAKDKYWDIDQMLFIHRYNPNTDIYSLSFVPLKPFMRYGSHIPVRRLRYFEEPGMPFTYEFSIIGAGEKFIYPISKKALMKKEYIYDYFPKEFPFYNILVTDKAESLAKYDDYKPYINKLKIKRAPDRKTDWIMVEFAVYKEFDIISGIVFDNDGNPIPPPIDSKWESFYMKPYECNKQLNNYIVVTIPLLLNQR